MSAQGATQAPRAATEPEVAPVAIPAAISATTGQRPAVLRSEEDSPAARRPVDAISLALAAAINEIAQRRAAERPKEEPPA